MPWPLSHLDATALAAVIAQQPGWHVVRVALMCAGNHAVECRDPEGCIRYIHSQAEWDWWHGRSMAGQGRVRKRVGNRRAAPAHQLGLGESIG